MSEKWIPEIGKLVVRQMLGVLCNQATLEYRDKEGDEQHFRSVSEMDDFVSRPHFGGSVECVHGQSDTSGSGNMIVRRYASDRDISAFLKLWGDKRNTVAEWLEEVQRKKDIDVNEKERLARLASS